MLPLRFRTELLVQRVIACARGKDRLVLRFRVAGGLLDHALVQPLLPERLARKKIRIAAEQDVRAAAGHIGGDGDLVELTGLRDDLRFLGVVFGVEHLMPNAAAAEQFGQVFAPLDRNRADEQRLAGLVHRLDLAHHGAELPLLGGINGVVVIAADQRPVCGNLHDVDVVDAHEFRFLGLGRTGHARKLLEHAEIVLEGDGRERLVLALDLHALLRLERLMQPLVEAAAEHEAAGEFIDDDDLPILYDIVLIALEQRVRAHCLQDVMVELGVVLIGKALHAEELLRFFDALRGELYGAALDVALVVAILLLLLVEQLVAAVLLHEISAPRELAHKPIRLLVQFARLLPRAADDERCACLIDQDGVHLVDDRIGELTLHHLLLIDNHIVAQIVKPEFVVRAVGDVARIGSAALVVVQSMHDAADAHAEEAVDLAHPLRVAAGQIVVDGDDMHALAAERIEVGRQRCDKRLALAGLHLRDAALMQDHTAEELYVKMAHLYGAHGGLPHGGKRFAHQIIQRLPVFQAVAEALRLRPKLCVAHRLHLWLKRIDALHIRPEFFQAAFARISKQRIDQSHGIPFLSEVQSAPRAQTFPYTFLCYSIA